MYRAFHHPMNSAAPKVNFGQILFEFPKKKFSLFVTKLLMLRLLSPLTKYVYRKKIYTYIHTYIYIYSFGELTIST